MPILTAPAALIFQAKTRFSQPPEKTTPLTTLCRADLFPNGQTPGKNQTRFKGPWRPSFFKPILAVFWQTKRNTWTYFHIPKPDGLEGVSVPESGNLSPIWACFAHDTCPIPRHNLYDPDPDNFTLLSSRNHTIMKVLQCQHYRHTNSETNVMVR